MREEYVREKKIKDKTDKDKEKELLISILKAREELKQINKNFELADSDMIDYYTYELKANQSKLDYLIKFAKDKGISLDMVEAIKLELYSQNDEVV